ncbi:energy transducer TonB [Dongia deserti]|uniref:energy transducer TonB n=1 Tax=Dongia deserti TaxID=2268030 RepID=UPI000E64861E|nr:energy transducer TonB [Dongia deserti]
MQLAAGHNWRPEAGLARWSVALATILLLHAGAALGGMIVWETTEPPTPPPAAIMLELAPIPAAPPAPQTLAPQEPEPVPEPEPEPPVDLTQLLLPIPELPLTPPDIPAPEVELPKPEPEKKKVEQPKPEKPKEKPKKEVVQKPKPKPEPDLEPTVVQKPAPQATQQDAAAAEPVPAAPTPAAPSAAEIARRTAAEANWQGMLQAHLQKHQKYPRSAQRRSVEGTAFIRFRMDRSGKVLSYSLVRSSGSETLDEAALAMIEDAQPLPPLPADLPHETIELNVPAVFNLKDAR